ncbi:MAG: hypothetical protein NTW65_05255 [Deltaproteobacteria bacterium]|nr:hypothetical protein [Deltaproteobacteria bacterium]
MKIFVCIDDTDNIDSRGTGELAALLAADIDKNGWGRSSYITRHQLLVHPDIPYTSHNSSMCFSADIDEAHMETFIYHAKKFLKTESAEGSDPGLCIVAAGRLEQRETIIAFGQKAKRIILTQREAYDLALSLGIHLSAHGGTGDGVIGALAGVGLRMSGNDGRLRGKIKIDSANKTIKVGEICAHPFVDEVRNIDGKIIPDEQIIELGEKVKTVLLGGKLVLLVMPVEGEASSAFWRTCPKHILKTY